MNNPAFDQFAVLFMFQFFLVFGLISFAVGIGLVCSGTGMHKLSGVMNHWVSMRHRMKWLAIPRSPGSALLNYQSVIGMIFMIAATSSTIILITRTDVSMLVAAFRFTNPSSLTIWIIESLRWLLITGSLFAIGIGIMLIFFPVALCTIETRANHWYSLRNHIRGGDTMHLAFDKWVERYPVIMGWIIAAGALIVIVNFGILLYSHN